MSDERASVHADTDSAIDVVSVQTLNGRWQSRFRDRRDPVGEGTSLKESVQNLLIHLPLQAHRKSVVIEERFDPLA